MYVLYIQVAVCRQQNTLYNMLNCHSFAIAQPTHKRILISTHHLQTCSIIPFARSQHVAHVMSIMSSIYIFIYIKYDVYKPHM